MNENPQLMVTGKAITTSSGSVVFVGHAEKFGDSTLIKFVGADGHATHIRLTKEAAVALRELLAADQGEFERDLIWQVHALADEFSKTKSSEPPTSSV